MAKRRNSLVDNINRRKRKGISRPKSKSTVSKRSYRQMKQGWPKKSTGKRSSAKKKTSTRKKRSTKARSR